MAPRKSALARLEDGLCGALLGVMTAVVFGSVVLRYAFNHPLGWSDELAKLCFTWLVFLGGAIGVRRSSNISIDAVVSALPSGPRRVLTVVADVLILVILIVFIYDGFLLSNMTVTVATPSLGLPVALVYAAAPVGALLMILHHLRQMASDITGRQPAATISQEGEA